MGVFKKIFSDKRTCVFVSAIAVLSIALIVASSFLIIKSIKLRKIDTELSKNESMLTSAKAEIGQYNSQIDDISEKSESYSNDTKSLKEKLAAAESEKKRLEQENAALKKQVATLTAQKSAKEQEAKRLVISKSQQSGVYDNTKVCYLTFDDGPSDNTPKILNILASYNVKATFFVVGTGKVAYIPQIRKGGHAIGLHANKHDYGTIYRSVDAYFADLNAISKTVENYIGEKSFLVRFPGGSSNLVSKRYCPKIMTNLTTAVLERGYSYFDWNVSSGDATGNNVPAPTLVNNVLTQSRTKGSICVLMHDTNAKGTTVAALPSIITGLYDMGYRFAPLTAATFGFHQPVAN